MLSLPAGFTTGDSFTLAFQANDGGVDAFDVSTASTFVSQTFTVVDAADCSEATGSPCLFDYETYDTVNGVYIDEIDGKTLNYLIYTVLYPWLGSKAAGAGS